MLSNFVVEQDFTLTSVEFDLVERLREGELLKSEALREIQDLCLRKLIQQGIIVETQSQVRPRVRINPDLRINDKTNREISLGVETELVEEMALNPLQYQILGFLDTNPRTQKELVAKLLRLIEAEETADLGTEKTSDDLKKPSEEVRSTFNRLRNDGIIIVDGGGLYGINPIFEVDFSKKTVKPL